MTKYGYFLRNIKLPVRYIIQKKERILYTRKIIRITFS